MGLEAAIRDIIPGQEQAYKAALAHTLQILTSMSGYQAHELKRCIERENRYLLLVQWDPLEAHTALFRPSAADQDWKALRHPCYDPFPTIEHYRDIYSG